MDQVYIPSEFSKEFPLCGKLLAPGKYTVNIVPCDRMGKGRVLCELNDVNSRSERPLGVRKSDHSRPSIRMTFTPVLERNSSLVSCREGHMTHSFFACDLSSACWLTSDAVYVTTEEGRDIPSSSSCPANLTSLPPSFLCSSGVQRVPYTLVCDHRFDCQDNSDENFCQFEACSSVEFECGSTKQCYKAEEICDGKNDCTSGEDEAACPFNYQTFEDLPRPPAVIDFYFHGQRTFQAIGGTGGDVGFCPDTHFQCPSSRYCLPVFVLCNGVYDCPSHEDEDSCSSFSCRGYYRCRSSRVCVHPNHLCDGLQHCPQHDDELLCDATCPKSCTCHGLAFICARSLDVSLHPQLRYLHATGTGMTLYDVTFNFMLVHLGLAANGISELDDVKLYNLHSLDLSENLLGNVSKHQFNLNWPWLRELSLAGNPLVDSFFVDDSPVLFGHLEVLDLSRVHVGRLSMDFFSSFTNLRHLNLSGCGIKHVTRTSHRLLQKLRSLDFSGSPITSFPRNMFYGLSRLKSVTADNYKLCCPSVLPREFNPSDCSAPSDELSSCSALLRSDVYRAVLCLLAVLALLGNAGSFLARVFLEKNKRGSSFVIFVVHLCVADFFMGIYLALIGIADFHYRGSYVWENVAWRHSAACKMAGVLCLLSSEVSALIVCLITLDRFLVLRFPFSRIRFGRKSSHAAGCVVWVVGVALSTLPLFPGSWRWEFYSQASTCVPLPITRRDFPGGSYSFGILIVMNFALFLLIVVGQASIYMSVRANAITTSEFTRQSRDITVARRLITIALTDFLCWFPIGLLGLLASQGVSVSGEVTVAMAICVLPVNSAVNPFLYTVNVLLERRNNRREELMFEQLLSSQHNQTDCT